MQGYNFTERVRKTLMYAREEASLLHHEYVGTEHILLGIVREGEGVASSILENLNVKLDTVRETVLKGVKHGEAAEATGPDLPYTSRSKKVLECAMTEARNAGHSYVGTEHLLLGLLREEKGIGAQVLVSLGVTLDKARAEMLAILGPGSTGNVASERISQDHIDAVGLIAVSGGGSASVGARLLLTISAAFAGVIGLMLIFNARGFEAPMGIVIDDKTETIVQAQGAILLGLGVINWMSRGFKNGLALWVVLYGNFVVQVVSLAVVSRALVRGIIPGAGAGAAVMHVILGAAFGWQLLKLRRTRG